MWLVPPLWRRLTVSSIVAITVATVVNYAVSAALFQTRFVDVIDEEIRGREMARYGMIRADYHRLRKMMVYWPQQENPLLTWGYTLGLYFLFTKVMVDGADFKVRPLNRDNEKFLNQSIGTRLFNSLVASIFIFMALLPVLRLCEMHFFIIGMNLVHHVLTSTCSNFIFLKLLTSFSRK
ncbi:hypothetical protein PFISCL1PPCAC_8387 [Pristionchus fissidentatus]|uniref:Uncharacterized protein n=1 Tax=Pristionchus fissidentatus TaxID=1538716 RepID=A0AAV5VBM6_9BILA|nr:hypothetical protein PFISCL1PPCAC_8387 [Pristionchus fissidentatus]